MDDTQLYAQILGIVSPWHVVRVELDLQAETVRVYLDYHKSKAQFTCPTCGQPSGVYDHREARSWRHLDSCQLKTFLVANLPRVECSLHGVLTVDVPWSEPHSRFTLTFEELAISVLRATQVQWQAARLLRLSPGQVHDIMERSVKRGLARRDKTETLQHLSLDEKSFHEGHHYITVLGDSVGKRVIDVVESRTQEATELLLNTALSPIQRAGVRSVSMDMWAAFMAGCRKALPAADIVHDRYHVASYLNDAVDQTRRAENRALAKQDDTRLNKTKYLWLKSQDNFTDKQRSAFEKLENLDLETAKVWAFKESFREFFSLRSISDAKWFFYRWFDAAIALENRALTKVAQMLSGHVDGLLAYIRHRVNNAIAEQMNGQIQRIKANARGYRKFESFRVAILFFLGGLSLYPQKSP
jgi:transposase